MNEEEKREYEELKSLLYTGTISQYGKRKLIDIIEKQQKEIEHSRELLNKYNDMKYFAMVSDRYISKDKIKEKIKEIETLSMLDFVEKEKFDFKYSLDGIYCMQKGVVFILKELLGE